MKRQYPTVGVQQMLVLSVDGRDGGNIRQYVVTVMKQRQLKAGRDTPAGNSPPAGRNFPSSRSG